MANVISGITNVENGVYILWGIAILGLVLKMISNAYIKMFMRKTENMATTKKRGLRVMRQKYENRRSLGMEGSSCDFVEKNIRNFRFMGLPFEAFCRHVNIGVYVTIMATAGAFLLYEPSWRGSPGMVTFLANSIMVCAFLLSLENIFLTRTKLEIMKANIRDYLDNISVRGAKPPEDVKRRQYSAEPSEDVKRGQYSAKPPADVQCGQGSVHKVCNGGNRIRDEAALAEAELAVTCDTETETAGNSEISLDGFLKEFFS
jgi:hypothetical protein